MHIQQSCGLGLGGKVLALVLSSKAKAKTFMRCPRDQGQASRTTRLVLVRITVSVRVKASDSV